MEPTLITFAPFGNKYTTVTVDVEMDLYIDHRTVTADPESREVAYVERAVMRVNGVEVPHEMTPETLAEILREWQDEQAELHDFNRSIQARWAA